MVDEWTTCFAAGNVVELLNLQTKEQTYIRSTSGGGIGAIAVWKSINGYVNYLDVTKI